MFTLTVTDGQATAATDSVTVTVVDPCGSHLDSVDKTITVGIFPWYLPVLPNSGHVYATNFSDDTLSVIQTSDHTVTATVSVGNGTGAIFPEKAGQAARLVGAWHCKDNCPRAVLYLT